MRLLFVRRINDLDVIGFVPRHHLVARDAVENGVHDRPLRRGFTPAPFGFLLREARPLRRRPRSQCSSPCMMKTRLQTMWPGLGNALQRAAAETEIHRRLPFAASPFVAADEMGGRRGA